MKKLASILLAAVFLSSVALAASQTPSHPLSHIHPSDTNLNMSEYGIFNASWINLTENGKLQIKDGLRITDDAIQDSARNDILVWDDNQNRWTVNADINMNDNEIQNFFNDSCGGGELVKHIYDNGSYQCESITGTTDDRYVNEDGDTMTGDLNMSQNDINNVSNINNFFAGTCQGDDVMKQVYPNGSYQCVSTSTLNPVEDLEETLGAGSWTGGIDINMTGSELDDYFQSNTCGPGEVIDGINSDGSYQCTPVDSEASVENLSTTLEAGNVANQSINMDENLIQGISALQDNTGTDTLRFDGGNNIEVPSGNLDVFGSITQTGSLQITDTGVIRSLRGDDTVYIDAGNGGTGSIKLRDSAGSDILSANEDGSVVIPNGNLNVDSNSITNVGEIQDFFSNACGDPNQVIKQIHSDGTYTCETIPEDAGVENLSSTLEAGNTANQSIYMGQNALNDLGALYSDDSSTSFFSGGASQSQTVTGINADGTLQTTSILIGTSNIRDGSVTNNKIANNAINTTQIIDGTISASDMGPDSITATNNALDSSVAGVNLIYNSGRLDVNDNWVNESGDTMSGNLGLGGNDIENIANLYGDTSGTNFFDSACSEGEVIEQINSDGSYVCTHVNNEVEDNWVNEGGDTMTGYLNMSNNEIIRIGSGATNITDTGRIELGENIDMNSGRLVNGDNKEISFSGGRISINGGLDIQSNTRLRDDNNLEFGTDTDYNLAYNSASGRLVLQNDGTDALRVASNEDIQVPNGNLDMGGNIVDNVANIRPQSDENLIVNLRGASSNEFRVFDNTESVRRFAVSQEGGVEILNGNLNLNSNNITTVNEIQGFFSNACNDPNEAVKQIHSDGTYTCETIPEDTGVEDLSATLEAGNVANQSIDMDGNDVNNVHEVSFSNDGNSGSIAEYGGNALGINSEGNVLRLQDSSSQDISAESNIRMNGNNVEGVNEISGDSGPVKVSNDIEMTGSSPEVDLGNDMHMKRQNGNVVISD